MPETVTRKIKILTKQSIMEDVPAQDGFPMRKWNIVITLLDQNDNEVPANIFDKVTYKLHETFANPTRVVKKPPFFIEEQGWGEFEMVIVLHATDKGGERTIKHDLNFQSNEYEVIEKLQFPIHRPNLAKLLAESGPVPGVNAPGASGTESIASPAETGDKRKSEEADNKLKKKSKTHTKAGIDLEQLAQGLQTLSEDDMAKIVEMINDNRTDDMYVKNDPDAGEFRFDLFTFPDSVLKSLWDFVKKK